MRILHIADIHLGHSLNGWTRESEHKIWFARLADLVEEQEIDALLIAGDVFDGLNPSGESQRLLYDALVELRRRRPHLTTVMIAGNHDPAFRLEAPRALVAGIDAHVLGTVRRKAAEVEFDRHLVPLRCNAGEVRAWVVAIPFLRPADLPGLSFAEAGGEGSPIVRAAAEFHRAAAEAAKAVCGFQPLIAMGHLHCSGALESEGAERRIPIGGEHAVPASVFPDCFAYVALGHLHGPQSLDGGRIRYSGSCFPLSASEIGHRHGATLVEIGPDGISHQHLEIERPSTFHRLPGTGRLDIAGLQAALDALDLDPDLPKDLQPFVYVTLEATGPASVLLTDAENLLSRYAVRPAGVKIMRREEQLSQADDLPGTLADINPEDLFLAAFRKANQFEAEDCHVLAFRDALSVSA